MLPSGQHAGSCALGAVVGFALAISMAHVSTTTKFAAIGNWGATKWMASYVARTTHDEAPRRWKVPSADIAASAHPMRSVGDRSDGAAHNHHRALAAEVAAADQAEVRRNPVNLCDSRLAFKSTVDVQRWKLVSESALVGILPSAVVESFTRLKQVVSPA